MSESTSNAAGECTSPGLSNFVITSTPPTFEPILGNVPTTEFRRYKALTASGAWERGRGQWTAGTNTLSRATIYKSSNANAKVNFSGVVTIYIVDDTETIQNLDYSTDGTAKVAMTVAERAAVAASTSGLSAHLADTSDAHDASAISFVPAGGISSTDVQAAIVAASTMGPSGGSSLTVKDEGTTLTTAATVLNFAGAGVTVTEPVADQLLVTITGAGSGAVDSVAGEVGVITEAELKAALNIDPIAEPFLAATTNGAQAFALKMSTGWLHAQAVNGKVLLVGAGASNSAAKDAVSSYTVNPNVRIWAQITGTLYPQSTNTADWGFVVATPTTNYGYPSGGAAWCGMVGTHSSVAHTNTMIEMANAINLRMGLAVDIVHVSEPSCQIGSFLEAGNCRVLLDRHVPAALANLGWSRRAHAFVFEHGGNDRNILTGSEYATECMWMKSELNEHPTTGFCSQTDTQTIVIAVSDYVLDGWSGSQRFAESIGANGHYIPSKDWFTFAHFSGPQHKLRGEVGADVLLQGPVAKPAGIYDIEAFDWRRAAVSDVAPSGSAVAFPFNAANALGAGDRIAQWGVEGAAKSWLTHEGNFTSPGYYRSTASAVGHTFDTLTSFSDPLTQFLGVFSNAGVNKSGVNAEGAFCGDGILRLKPYLLGSATAQLNLDIAAGVLSYDFLGTKSQKFSLSNRTGTTGTEDYFTFQTAATNTIAATKLFNLINGGSKFSVQTAGDILNNGVHTSNVATGGTAFTYKLSEAFAAGTIAKWLNFAGAPLMALDYLGEFTIANSFVNSTGYYTSLQADATNGVGFTYEIRNGFTGSGQWLAQWHSAPSTPTIGFTKEGYLCSTALSGGTSIKVNGLLNALFTFSSSSSVGKLSVNTSKGVNFNLSGKTSSADTCFTFSTDTEQTTATHPLVKVTNAANTKYTLNAVGLPGFFGVTPPTARPTGGANTPSVAGVGSTITIKNDSQWNGGLGGTGHTLDALFSAVIQSGLLAA